MAAKTWTKEMILEKLEKSATMVERSLLKLYERQTADEQLSMSTTHENGQGFNGVDAEFLSSLSEWIKKSHRKDGEKLTPGQLKGARKAIRKYAGQLALIANEEAASKAPPAPPVYMDMRSNRSKTKQHAWTDEYSFEVPITNPNATDADIQTYLNSLTQGLSGRLRGVRYVLGGRTLDGARAIIECTESLCD